MRFGTSQNTMFACHKRTWLRSHKYRTRPMCAEPLEDRLLLALDTAHEWINPNGGQFHVATNWDANGPNEVPGAGDTAFFNQSSTEGYTVTFDSDVSNDRLAVGDDNVIFDLNQQTYRITSEDAANRSVVIGTEATDLASLTVRNGSLEAVVMGIGSSRSSSLAVADGGSITTSSSVVVGEFGNGTFDIDNGGSVSVGTRTVIGGEIGGEGSVTVHGNGSTVTTGEVLLVGDSGTGTLAINQGGIVSVGDTAFIGMSIGGDGGVTVTGDDSTMTTGEALNVGFSGNGTIDINSGGAVSVEASTSLGINAGSNGGVTVDGSGSILTSSAQLLVGLTGHGTLDVNSGGAVAVGTNAFVGAESGSDGNVTVEGNDSTFTTAGALTVADAGHGALEIENGGAVSVGTNAFVAAETGIGGSVTVDGSDSSFTTEEQLEVGFSGNGTLDISNGGFVSAMTATAVGINTGSEGSVTVDGSGSTLASAGQLQVGFSGNGTLEIHSGGLASIGTSAGVGLNAESVGDVTVDGSSSTLTTGEALVVGNSGRGTLDITGGGTVSVGTSAGFGLNAESVGGATVDGSGSSLTTGGELVVGLSGNGTLDIHSRGAVSVLAGTGVGLNPGSVSRVTIDGDGSNLMTGGSLVVGDFGDGTLDITNGGSVSVEADTFLAARPGGNANVTVEGPGSTLTSGSELHVGLSGTATLDVNIGGTLIVSRDMSLPLNIWENGSVNLAGGTITTNAIANTNGGTFHWTSGVVNLTGGDSTSDFAVPHTGELKAVGSITGTVNNAGLLAPGMSGDSDSSTGTLLVNGQYRQNPDSMLEIELSDGEHDVLQVTEDAMFDGTLHVVTINSYQPNPGDVFTFLTAGSHSGRFANVVAEGPIGLSYEVDYDDATMIRMRVVAQPGDANLDGVVDSLDFEIWRAHRFTEGTNWRTGDFNSDGVTDVRDFNIWNARSFLATPLPASTIPLAPRAPAGYVANAQPIIEVVWQTDSRSSQDARLLDSCGQVENEFLRWRTLEIEQDALSYRESRLQIVDRIFSAIDARDRTATLALADELQIEHIKPRCRVVAPVLTEFHDAEDAILVWGTECR